MAFHEGVGAAAAAGLRTGIVVFLAGLLNLGLADRPIDANKSSSGLVFFFLAAAPAVLRALDALPRLVICIGGRDGVDLVENVLGDDGLYVDAADAIPLPALVGAETLPVPLLMLLLLLLLLLFHDPDELLWVIFVLDDSRLG